MTALKPIETVYKGYRFRSRLEARWAVFFETVGVKWDYEVEGYDLGPAGWYLPDFWLPDNNVFVEIKGAAPTEQELERARKLSEIACTSVALTKGDPMEYSMWVYWRGVRDRPQAMWGWGSRDGHHPECIPCYQDDVCTCCGSFHGHPHIFNAAQAARSARFEHGEQGSPRSKALLAVRPRSSVDIEMFKSVLFSNLAAGAMTTYDIAHYTGTNKDWVLQVLESLKAEGKVTWYLRGRQKEWSLT